MRSDKKYSSTYGRPPAPDTVVPRVNMEVAMQAVRNKLAFDSSTCYARWMMQTILLSQEQMRERILNKGPWPKDKRNYVVYTGVHHPVPLFIYDADSDLWFEQQGIIFGRITTQARKRLRPATTTMLVDEPTMTILRIYGYRQYALSKLNRKPLMGYWGSATGRFNSAMDPMVAEIWRNKK